MLVKGEAGEGERMPFVGLCEGQRIDITEFPNAKLTLKGREIICPYCSANLNVVGGNQVIEHFRHDAACKNLIAQAYFSGETPEHKQAKKFLKGQFTEHLGKYTTLVPELEVMAEDAGRIADLMVTYPFGYRQAIEVQLSRVPAENIQERTESYIGAGIDVVWVLGKNVRDPLLVDYLKRKFGHTLLIEDVTTIPRLFVGHRLLSPGGPELQPYLADGQEWVWNHFLLLAFARYLQINRGGFSPDFNVAVQGKLTVESFFGGKMSSLRNEGAVTSTPTNFSGRRSSPKLWNLLDAVKARKWFKDRWIDPMQDSALAIIKARSACERIHP